jgi:hypothetical protein
MHSSPCLLFFFVAALVGCSGGPPGPPVLAIAMAAPGDASYDYESEAVIRVSVMGQSMSISQEGAAVFGLSFRSGRDGLDVTLAVEELSATLTQPLGAPVVIDEGDVSGTLDYTLDRFGNATVTRMPEVQAEATQMVSGLALAHRFFPGLPGRPVAAGERWVDTIAYEGDGGAGVVRETAIYEYTVRGDTVVAGRRLLHLGLAGTTESSGDLNVGGMAVRQSTDLTVEGYVLWDRRAGVLFESMKRGLGKGTVTAPIVPGPLPITIETMEHSRLRPSDDR